MADTSPIFVSVVAFQATTAYLPHTIYEVAYGNTDHPIALESSVYMAHTHQTPVLDTALVSVDTSLDTSVAPVVAAVAAGVDTTLVVVVAVVAAVVAPVSAAVRCHLLT